VKLLAATKWTTNALFPIWFRLPTDDDGEVDTDGDELEQSAAVVNHLRHWSTIPPHSAYITLFESGQQLMTTFLQRGVFKGFCRLLLLQL